MKGFLLNAATFLATVSLFHPLSVAQISLGVSPYIENFNSIGNGLPPGWTVRTGATGDALGNAVAFGPTGSSWANATGNFKNFAGAEGLMVSSNAAAQSASVNRALGIRQTGTFGDPGACFVLRLSNTSGLTSFVLTFQLQSLDGGSTGRTTTWKVDYALGAMPSSFVPVDTHPAPLSVVLSASGWGSAEVSVNFGTALDDFAGDVWIRMVTLSTSSGSGSRPSVAIDNVALSFLADTTPPMDAFPFPEISNITSSGFDLSNSLDEPGKTFFTVLAHGAPAPNSVQVVNGQDGDGSQVLPGYFGMMNVNAQLTTYAITLSSLKPATDYDVYVVSMDKQFNLQPVPIFMSVRIAPKDITPPAFGSAYPRADFIQPSGFALLCSLDEAGVVYFVIQPSGNTAPTSFQIRRGTGANDLMVSPDWAGTTLITDPEIEFSYIVAGLRFDTAYDIYLVAEDRELNLQPSPAKISVTTGGLFVDTFDNCGTEDSFNQFNVAGSQVWGCTSFGRGSKGMRMNGFSGSAFANEDWLISPLIRLETHPSLSFYSQFSFPGNVLQLKISKDYPGTGNPKAAVWVDIDGKFPAAAVASSSTALTDWTFSEIDLSAYANQSVYVAFVYVSTGLNAARWSLDEVAVGNAKATYLTATATALSLKAYGPAGSYVLTGFNLTDGVTITAPAGFEVSRALGDFSNSVSYSAIEAQVPQTVFVRFAPLPDMEATNAGTIQNMSTHAATRNIFVRGADVSRTFDVVTWNLNFFGTNVKNIAGSEFGPTNDELQIRNVETVMQHIEADLYAVEEVSDDDAFANLVASLPGYDKILSNRWSYSFDGPDPYFPSQKLGFIYNTATVRVISSRVLFEKLYDDVRAGTYTLPQYPGGNGSGFWSSGRLPFMAKLAIMVNGVAKQIRVIVFHAKSGATRLDYDRRKYDVQVLRDSMATYFPGDPVILLGDFNDDVDESVLAGLPSPFQSFVDDPANFNALTYTLSQSGAASFPGTGSFLDHVVVSKELTGSIARDGVFIEEAGSYITGYAKTTSDHLPVVSRFQLTKIPQEITFQELPDKSFGDPSFSMTAATSSGLGVMFTTSSDKVVVQGNQVTILRPGRVSIRANQPGNMYFLAAGSVDRNFCIHPEKPRITMSDISSKTVVLTSSAAEGNQWFLNGSLIEGATDIMLETVTTGVYHVQSSVDDCVSPPSTDMPVIITGDLIGCTQMALYPNPVADHVELTGIDDVREACLVDIVGRVSPIKLEKKGTGVVGETGQLTPGVYLLLVYNRSGVHQARFVKK